MKKQQDIPVSKAYNANFGVALDHDFLTHAANCEKRRQFDPQKPATAVALCLEGAVLWKRDNVVVKRQRVERPDNFATKAEMKAAMRYKGE